MLLNEIIHELRADGIPHQVYDCSLIEPFEFGIPVPQEPHFILPTKMVEAKVLVFYNFSNGSQAVKGKVLKLLEEKYVVVAGIVAPLPNLKTVIVLS